MKFNIIVQDFFFFIVASFFNFGFIRFLFIWNFFFENLFFPRLLKKRLLEARKIFLVTSNSIEIFFYPTSFLEGGCQASEVGSWFVRLYEFDLGWQLAWPQQSLLCIELWCCHS